MMIDIAGNPDEAIAKEAITSIGLCGMSEAVPMLAKLVNKDTPLRNDAAGALIAMKSPDSVAALEKIAVGSSFEPDLRARAAAAIGALDNNDAQAAVIRIVASLDSAKEQSPAVLEKLTDALSGRAATTDRADALVKLTKDAQQRTTRIAAAQSLLRGSDQAVKDRVAKLWESTD
jgi:HEAT repeat protein